MLDLPSGVDPGFTGKSGRALFGLCAGPVRALFGLCRPWVSNNFNPGMQQGALLLIHHRSTKVNRAWGLLQGLEIKVYRAWELPSPYLCPSTAFARLPPRADSLHPSVRLSPESFLQGRTQPRRSLKRRVWKRRWCLATRLERLPLLPRPPQHSMRSLPSRAEVSQVRAFFELT